MFGLAVLIGSIALAASGEAGGVRPPANLYVTYSNAAAFERAFSTRRNWLRDDSVVTIKAARCSIVCCSCRKGIQEPSYDVYLFYKADNWFIPFGRVSYDSGVRPRFRYDAKSDDLVVSVESTVVHRKSHRTTTKRTALGRFHAPRPLVEIVDD